MSHRPPLSSRILLLFTVLVLALAVPGMAAAQASIGASKNMTSTGSSPYSVAMDFYFENFGTVDVQSLSLVDNLSGAFGVGNFAVRGQPVLVSGPSTFTVNPTYDGLTDPELLRGGSFSPGETAQVRVMVDVFSRGIYRNQVLFSGFTPGGMSLDDISTDGTDPDPDGDGRPTERAPSGIVLENPVIGAAKTMTAGPGPPWTVMMNIYLENFGDTTIQRLSMDEDLDAVFGAGNYTLVSGPTVVNGPGRFTLNQSYDGSTDTELLGGGSLGAGQTARIRLVLAVTAPGTYVNQVEVTGMSPENTPVSDLSTAGADPDGSDGDGDPDEMDPTVLELGGGVIGAAKDFTASGTGPFDVLMDLYFENFGTLNLVNMTLLDDLDAVFGAGNYAVATAPVVVSGPGTFTVNAGFNGSTDQEVLGGGSLAPGQTAQVRVALTVNNVGSYSNQVTVNTETPGGTPVSDLSTAGTDPDGTDNDGNPDESDPTPLLLEGGLIGVAKNMTATGNGPFAVTMDLYFENFGLVPLSNLSLPDDFDAVFGPGNYALTGGPTVVSGPAGFTVNGAFDGSGNTEVLGGGTLGVGETAHVQILFDLTATGTYINQVTVTGETPSGAPVSDLSTTGTDPDGSDNDDNPDESDPTVLNTATGIIGVAKNMTAAGTGPYAVTLDLYFENFGMVALSNLSLPDDLDAVFGAGNYTVTAPPALIIGPGTFTLNAGFNGSSDPEVLGGGSLDVGEVAQVRILLDVTASGTFTNQVTVSGETPTGTPVTDVSTDGTDPDGSDNDGSPDESVPSMVSLENGVIGVAKDMTATGTGPYNVDVDFYFENFGDVAVSNLSAPDDFDAVFGAGNYVITGGPTLLAGPGTFAVNAGFDGSADTELLGGGSLDVGETAQVRVQITLTNAGTYTNQITLTGETPSGAPVSDLSTSGTDPDGTDNDGNPDESDPTVLNLEDGVIGVAKTMSATGTGPYAVTVDLYFENFGDVTVSSLSLLEDLDSVFGAGSYALTGGPTVIAGPATFTVNPAFDGSATQEILGGGSLAMGETAQLQFTLDLTAGGQFINQVTVNGLTPGGNPVSDLSTDGTDPDGTDGDDNPDESDPTVLDLENAVIGLAKNMTATGTGPYDVTVDFYYENFGDVTVSGLSMQEDLALVFGAANYTLNSGPTIISGPPSFNVNSGFDGAADTEVLGGGSLGVGQTAQVRLTLTLAAAGLFTNQVTVDGLSPLGFPVSDVSTDGTDPDGGDGDDNPDEMDPSILDLEAGVLGVAKNMTAVGMGPWTVTVLYNFENFGNVALSSLSALDDLDAVFGAGNYVASGGAVLVSGPAGFTANTGFDGSTDQELLGGGTLDLGETAAVRVQLTVTVPGTYTNQVTGTGLTPGGTPVADLSTAGADPDGTDDDGNPDESDPTLLVLGNQPAAVIGVAKTMTDLGTRDPYSALLDLYFENLGGSPVTQLMLEEDLNLAFGAGNWALTGGPTVVAGPATFGLNPGFDGATDLQLLNSGSLASGETAQVQMTVEVTAPGTYTNQVTVNGRGPANQLVSDVSTTGTDPDPSGDGLPTESVPTVIAFETPVIGLAKDAVVTSADPISVRLDFYLVNYGDVPLQQVRIQDDLDVTFGPGNYQVAGLPRIVRNPGGGGVIDPAFNGSGNIELLDPQSTLAVNDTLVVELDLIVLVPGTYSNVADAFGATLTQQVTDRSTAGTDPDPGGDGDPTNDSDPTPIVAVGSPLVISKVSPMATVGIGGLVPYVVEMANTSMTAVNNVDLSDTPPAGLHFVEGSGRIVLPGPDAQYGTDDDLRTLLVPTSVSPLVFSGLDVAAGETIYVEYVLRVGAGVTPGEAGNVVVALVEEVPVSNTSTAVVDVVDDSLFARSTVVGKVFCDLDGDGWQNQDGEVGLAGVRLITASGLILETDAYGRFHLDDLDGGFYERGREFIVKVDMNSLPPGSRMTSENPRVLHITPNALNRMTFGVELPEAVQAQSVVDAGELTLTRSASHGRVTWVEAAPDVRTIVLDHVTFETSKAVLRPDAMAIIGKVADSMLADPTATASIIGHTDIRRIVHAPFDDNYHLSLERAKSVRRALMEMGVKSSRLTASGFGPDRPVADGRTAAALQKNRRVEITIRSDAGRGEIAAAPRFIEHRIALDLGGSQDVGPLVVEETLPALLPYRKGSSMINGEKLADPEMTRTDDGIRMRWTLPGLEAGTQAKISFLTEVGDMPGVFDLAGQTRLQMTEADRWSDAAQWRADVLWDTKESGRQRTVDQRLLRFPARSTVLNDSMRKRLAEIAAEANERDVVRVDVIGLVDQDELTEGQRPNASELTDGRIEVVRAELNRRLNLDRTLVRAFPVGVPNDERGQGGAVKIRLHTVVSALAGGDADPAEPAPSAVAMALESDGGNTAQVGPGVGRVKFPNGGTMNIVQDAADPQPRLDVLTQEALTVFGGRLTEPVTFRAETNYGAYVDRHELVVLGGRDPEGSRPLAVVEGAGAPPSIIRWDGTTQRDHTFAEHDQLYYFLRVWDADARMDVTRARTLTLTGTEVHGVDFNQIAEKIVGQDNTERRSIPVHGTRVRMEGTMPPGSRLALDGREVAADAGGRFIAEEILPDGLHNKQLTVVDAAKLQADMEAGRMPVAGGSGAMGVPLAIEVDGDDSFFVGIADLTVGQNDLSGPGAFLVNDPRFDNDVFTQGRLAFYLRERLGGGRGQFTAHLDTHEEELENIFKNLDNKDPRRLFRRLDADRYHHNYGDGSTVTPDVDTQGRFYGRLDWDQSRLMWGNYATGLTGTEFAEFNRTLYGGLLNYRSTAATDDAESRVQATAFASEAETAFSHEEFLGTGGSLYYLRYRDVVQGSEKIFVEIRDRDSDRVTDRRTLLRGRDYEFDDLQGRVILSRPLLQIADQISPSIIKDEPLDGNRARLIVDYEYLPVQTADADWLYGGRAKAWVVDELAVGGTYVDESRAGQDYQMIAGDVTVRGGAGTYIKGEYAETEASQASNSLFSDDGGFTFRAMDATPTTVDRTGEAMSAEARLDLADFSNADVELTGWYKDQEAGFSTARLGTGQEITSYGGELRWHTRVFSVSGRWASAERPGLVDTDRVSGQIDWRPHSRLQLGAEIRQINTQPSGQSTTEIMTGGARIGFDVVAGLNLYVAGQQTLDTPGEDEQLGTVGMRAQVGDKLAVRAEGSAGDAGHAVRAGVDLDASDVHTLYGTYTLSADRADEGAGTFTVGQQRSLTDQLSLFTENRFLHGERQSGIGHVYGLNFAPSPRFSASATYERSELEDGFTGTFEREAISAGLSARGPNARWRGTGEYREDEGAVERTQWLTTQRADWDVSPSLSLLGKLNFSVTEAEDSPDDAKFAETGVGIAYRPVMHDRVQFLAKHTFLYDLPARSQTPGGTDQRSHVFLGDVLYDIFKGFELGGRYGHRRSELREARDTGAWYESNENLAGARIRYHVTHQWDAIGEYRWRWVEEADDMHRGALLGLYRHLGRYLKFGGGYNFSDFSDDLTNLDYDHQGWFVKAIGKI